MESHGISKAQKSMNPVFIQLGKDRHYGSKVSCPRTKKQCPGQGSNPDHLSPAHVLLGHHASQKKGEKNNST